MDQCDQCGLGMFQPKWGKDHCLMMTADGREAAAPSAEVSVVRKNLTLEMDLDLYNETEVRYSLAAVYGIAVERISLEVSAGSMQLVATFWPVAATNSSTAEPPLMQLVEGISDADLGTSLNTTVHSSSHPEQATVQRPALTISCAEGCYCPPGASAPLP